VIAEQPLCPLIEALDESFVTDDDDAVVGSLEDVDEMLGADYGQRGSVRCSALRRPEPMIQPGDAKPGCQEGMRDNVSARLPTARPAGGRKKYITANADSYRGDSGSDE